MESKSHYRSKDVKLTLFWISLALIFNLGIYFAMGSEAAVNFFTGYLVEKSLSVDNLFVFLVIFKSFHIAPHDQHKILMWGIIGAIVLRAIFIFAGLALISAFDQVFYIFGAFLIFAGYKMLFQPDKKIEPEKHPLILLLERFVPVTHSMENGHFFIDGKATPLFLALISIEFSDVVFALDSIPAIFGITQDPFIVLTSNLFAILGLRSLYFVLESTISTFKYLHYGLAAILVFIGVKMLGHGYLDVSPLASLIVILFFLGISILPTYLIKAVKEE
jgi:tellurite resistance protein TerC